MPGNPLRGFELRAGRFCAWLDTDTGSLRYVHVDGHEVLRSISAPVRDTVWATLTPEVRGVRTHCQEDAFSVSFDVRCQRDAIDFCWRGAVVGGGDLLTFELEGEALSDFGCNRVGFCVLHPATAQGAPCRIEHADGQILDTCFPRFIQPHVPFTNMRAITHDVAPGLRAEVRMEGGEFEMEDQRNWTDASFKSYSPPLQHPRPIRFLRGTPIRQRIGVRIVGQSAAPVAPASPRWESPANVEIRVGAESSCRLPALGTLWTETTATVETVTALQRLRLSHLRVDFWAGDNMSAARLLAAASAARSLDAALELAIFARDDLAATLVHVCALLGEVQPRPRVARWLVFHETAPATPRELVLVARQVLASSAFAAPIGGGACDNFAEFNRNHEAAEISDFTVHACNPQVHAFDDVSVVETLEIQAQAVENARRLSHGKPVCVSLVTLPRRWRKGEGGAPETRPSNLMPFKGDSRHGSAFNAAWTFGSLASLARAGTASVTYFEVMGTNGLIAPPGTPLPVFETLRQVTAFGTLSMRETTSSNPLVVDAMAFEHADEVCLLVANLTAATRQVSVLPGGQLHQVAFSPFEVRMLKCERSRLLC